MLGRASSSGLRYTTRWWVCVSLSCSIQAFPSPHHTLSSHIDPVYLSSPIFLHFWHEDIPLLFPVFPILTRSAVSGPGGANGAFRTSSSLRQFGDTLSPMVNLSLRWMPGGVLGADQWPLLSLTLGEKGEGKEVGGEQREWTWQRPWNKSVPLSRARGGQS